MSTVGAEQVWEWLYPPLQDLKQDHVAEPGKAWEECRLFLLERLGISDPGEHPVAAELVRRLEELADSDRDAILGSDDLDAFAYQVVLDVATSGDLAGEGDGEYDENAWVAFLATNGTAWDGTAESWDQFRAWFLYQAEEQGLASPVNALVALLDEQPVEERVATFAQYGVTIAA